MESSGPWKPWLNRLPWDTSVCGDQTPTSSRRFEDSVSKWAWTHHALLGISIGASLSAPRAVDLATANELSRDVIDAIWWISDVSIIMNLFCRNSLWDEQWERYYMDSDPIRVSSLDSTSPSFSWDWYTSCTMAEHVKNDEGVKGMARVDKGVGETDNSSDVTGWWERKRIESKIEDRYPERECEQG